MPRRSMKSPMQLKKEAQERAEAKERAKENMFLTGGQAKLDKNKNNKLDSQDFKILRAEKAKGRGMGLQDEKLKPGKVIKAKRGTRLDFPVINRVKINKKSLNKNLMKTKNPYSELVKTTAKGPPRYSSMAEMRKAKGFLPGESAEDFNKRRMKLQRASKALRATRIGKIALGVAAAAMAGKEYLKSKSKKKEKKMGGGMMKKYNKGGGPDSGIPGKVRDTIAKYSSRLSMKDKDRLTQKDIEKAKEILKSSKKMGGGMMQKPMGYDIGGGVSKAKEHKKILKDKVGTALGYMGEMTKNIGMATPILAAKEAAKLIKNKRTISMEEAKKQREEAEKRRIPQDFYPKYLKNKKMRKKIEMQEYRPKAERKEYKDGGMMNPKPQSQQKFRGRAQPKGARRVRGIDLSDFNFKKNGNAIIVDLGLESSKYKNGGSVTAKCKLGKNKPTKIY